MLIICITPLIAGCFSGTGLQISEPSLTLHKESRMISWNWIKNSRRYDIYCNDEFVESIVSSANKNHYFYDFSTLLTDVGDYEFNVVAIASTGFNSNSDESLSVTYSCTTPYHLNVPENSIVPDIDESNPVSVSVTGTRVNVGYNVDFNVDGYELYLYSASAGLKVYPIDMEECRVTENQFKIDLNKTIYNLQDEIYAIKIGYIKNGERKLCSSVKYFNPDNYSYYCDDENIYIFDGYIGDMYIESIQELHNLIYYSFINRETTLSIKLSEPFQDVIEVYTGISGTDFKSKLLEAVVESFDYFYETRDGYDILIKTNSIAAARYEIEIGYKDPAYLNLQQGLPEPDITYIPNTYYYEEIDWQGFYETCGYTMRADDEKYATEPYEFVSDKQFMREEVSSSEQLYWAVENKITPVCATNSRADKIYTKAKNVLNSILSDDMTDYEKTLSIFDWICKNTSYDYYALTDGAYDNRATLVPVYYLEGVFETGFAVCDGFSKAFSLMCNMEGIDSIRIVGTADGGGHAWNKVLLDIDPTDEKDAQYYVVDITWTELKGALYFNNHQPTGGNEVSSHEYFLVDDEYISQTHTPFANRLRYEYYESPERYDYYDSTTFTFDGSDYQLAMTQNTTTFDLVIESEDELTAMFYYLFVNNLDSIEVVFDLDFMKQVDIDAGGRGKFGDEMINRLIALMKEKKFGSQYLFLQSTYTQSVYNSAGELGIVMVLENNLLIDAPHEAGMLLNFISHYNLSGTYELYIEDKMLEGVVGVNDLQKAKNLFKSAMDTYNVDMEFELISSASEENENKAYYIVKITSNNE
jgi:hypothetical protein